MDALKGKQAATTASAPDKEWKFSDILAEPIIRDRWEKVRQYFFLRESTYDMSNRCNIRCEGCYYYEGDKQFARENKDPEAWRELMRAEKERGITFVVLAGAEPSIAADLCKVCYQEMPLGTIASNGLKFIPDSIQYKIHISVWGNDETSLKIRNAPNMLDRQIKNYKNDPRAVFIYTFTRNNIDQVYEVSASLAEQDCQLTFNMFSAPVGYDGLLRHTAESLAKTRETMIDLLLKYPRNVLFSYYNAVAHTHRIGLHDLYGCSYPRNRARPDLQTVSHGFVLE
jgi:MoaA/NifB/PqqE/SkfB family radical SAM enzyme